MEGKVGTLQYSSVLYNSTYEVTLVGFTCTGLSDVFKKIKKSLSMLEKSICEVQLHSFHLHLASKLKRETCDRPLRQDLGTQKPFSIWACAMHRSFALLPSRAKLHPTNPKQKKKKKSVNSEP